MLFLIFSQMLSGHLCPQGIWSRPWPPTAQSNAQGDLAEGNESVGHSLATQLPLGAHKRGGEARTGARQPVAVGLPQLPRRQRLRLVRESDGGRDAVAGWRDRRATTTAGKGGPTLFAHHAAAHR